MVGTYEPEITNRCVANLGNSLAITCDLRLAPQGHCLKGVLGDFESHIRSPRINQRFLKNECFCALHKNILTQA
jgi:hypothetical protein